MLPTLIVSLAIVFICVLIHYEALYRFEYLCNLFKIKGRLKVVAATLWGILAHTIEVWVFAVGYYLLVHNIPGNNVVDVVSGKVYGYMDMVYFSFVSYTSVGYGDLIPAGPVRFMAGTESLAGLVFIGWTASFLYLKMEADWKGSDKP